MNDISFDLETLSTQPDAAIVSIGATLFDRATGEIGDTFYQVIDLADAVETGHVSGDTLKWWMRQTDAARQVFSSDMAVPLNLALVNLAGFVSRVGPDGEGSGPCVWGNGAHFDISILEHAFGLWALPVPWKFWDVRDMRTVVDVATMYGFDKRSIPFEGVAHNALDDSIHQASVISKAIRHFLTI